MIRVRPLDLSPEGLDRSAAMLRAAMPRAGHMNAAFLRWQYVDNPAGAARGLEAFDGDTMVSHCAVQPLQADLRGEKVFGVLSLNAATLPAYLGRGIYFGMARDVYASARADAFRFGIAVTNDQSTPGFQRHCGFSLVGPLEARLGVGASPGSLATSARGPGADDDAADFRKSWTEETLAWRLTPPHVRYRRQRAATGTTIFAPSSLPGVDVELGTLPREHAGSDAGGSASRISPLRLWVGMDRRIRWTRSLYWNLPLRIRPSPLNLIFVDLAQPEARLDPERVRWRGLDFDTF